MTQTSLKEYISVNQFWYNLLELQTERFSGTLELDNPSGTNWKMYFYLGRLLYATGGKHPVRRWIRHIKQFAPQISLKENNLWTKERDFNICWEYEILSQWNVEGKIEREQVRKIIQGVIQEIFFDLHRMRITPPKIKEEDISFSQQWTLISLEEYITHSNKEWKNWQDKGIADLDPEKRPIIARTEELSTKMPLKGYQNMVKLFSSQSTLWELSLKLKQPVLDLTVSLLPYFRSGIMEMVEVEDWLSPDRKKIPIQTNIQNKPSPLIACINDNAWLSQIINNLTEKVGWTFLDIQDPLKSVSILLAKKPNLILVDAKMPLINGYELCEVMRKIPILKRTPIILLIGQDGLIDRMRAKMAGATDFISQSAEPEKLMELLSKYLNS